MNDDGRADDLITAYFDGSLEVERIADLERLLHRDPALRRRFWHEAMFARQLHFELQRPVVRPERSRGVWTIVGAVLAAMLLFGIGGWWWARAGQRTPAVLRAGGEALTTRCPDGSRLVLAPGSVLEPRAMSTGLRYRLVHGSVTAEVVDRRGRGPFVIAGHHFEARVVGTRFQFRTDADTTILRVEEGVVEWVDPGNDRSGRLAAGQEHFALSKRATASLPDMARGIDVHGDGRGRWRRLSDDAWTWRRGPTRSALPIELTIGDPPFTGAGCYALVYTGDRDTRIRVWPEGLARAFDLAPIPAVAESGAACRGAVREVVNRDGMDEEMIVVIVAIAPLGRRYYKDWYEVQFFEPNERLLAVGDFKGLYVAGDSEAAVRPDAVWWRPLVVE